MEDNSSKTSPWRQPMVWLVVGIPTIAVIALVWMVIIAAGPGATDSIDNTVKRTAQIQTADLSPDQTAARLQLAALLRVDGESLELLPLHAGFDTGKPLSLTLRHPVRSDLDQTFQLQPQAGNWRAPAPGLRFDHDWTLLLVPADGAWRLQGRLVKGQLSARVQPVAPG